MWLGWDTNLRSLDLRSNALPAVLWSPPEIYIGLQQQFETDKLKVEDYRQNYLKVTFTISVISHNSAIKARANAIWLYKVLGPCTLGVTKSRNYAIISQYNLLLYRCTFSNSVPVCLINPFKIDAFFLVPQVLINSIYDAFIASKIPTTKVSFQIRTQREVL